MSTCCVLIRELGPTSEVLKTGDEWPFAVHVERGCRIHESDGPELQGSRARTRNSDVHFHVNYKRKISGYGKTSRS